VYYRGLLEFSNLCQRNCLYCGIRAGNTSVDRFTLSLDEIGETAKCCAENGYGSLTLQSGERSDAAFVDFVEQAILRIKAESRSENQPEGLGITLCVGELDEASLRRLMTAGAHRYLLRVETTNPQLYAQLHPGADGGLDQRVANLRLLKRLGFQVGTGVMIGLPGQTMADLAADLHFFYNEGVQMIGMGPYIPHQDTPLGAARFSAPGAENAGGGGGRPERQPGGTRVEPETAAAVRPRSSAAAAAEDAGAGGAGARGAPPLSGSPDSLLPDRVRFELGLAMVALARIMLPASNVAATTALQALHPFGRELGLDSGANILMPLVTPGRVRGQYQLYDGKPCVDDELDECRDCLAARVSRTRREVGYHAYGDSLIPVDRG
jgi:biotin synthase